MHFRPTEARIDLAALRHNVAVLARNAAPENLIPVVKANAYGHGAALACRALSGFVDMFAVATLDEALALRASGVREQILVLQGAHSAEGFAEAAAQRLTLMLENFPQLDRLARMPAAARIGVWLKIDTGMHRLGFQPDDIDQAMGRVMMCPQVRHPVVLASHFASADQPLSLALRQQMQRFSAVQQRWSLPTSFNNSAGSLLAAKHRGRYARCGYSLYGGHVRNDAHPVLQQLRAVMSLCTQIISLRTLAAGEAVGYDGTWVAARRSRIATLPIGYADGYPRHAPSGTPVWIAGRRAPLVGRVSMDLITVDVTDIPEADYGSAVELWGSNLPVDDVAQHAGTIGYQLVSALTARVPRVPVFQHGKDFAISSRLATAALN